jgi:hypothetical protein
VSSFWSESFKKIASLLLRGRTCNPCLAFALLSASKLVRYTHTTHFFKLSSSKIFNNTCSLYFFLIPKKGIALLPVIKLAKKIKKMLKGHRPGTISKTGQKNKKKC